MSMSSTLDPPTGTGTDEQRIELTLPNGGRVIVICRFHLGMNVPVVGPPKPPKGPTLMFPVDDDIGISIETEVLMPG
ncbi:hypothetical protein ACVWWW_002144 [Lysobacter sp. HA18]